MAELYGLIDYEKIREKLVGVALKPPLYNSVSAAGNIVSFAPSPGKYPILVLFEGTTDTDGNTIELQVLCTDNVWRTFLKVRFLGKTAFAMGFPSLKLDKVNIGGTEYAVKAGDGATATLKAVAGGSGVWEAFLWVGEG
jgi:hypothetical protein